MTRTTLLAFLLLAALAVAGCGDDVKATNNYVAATNDAVTSFEATFATLQTGFTATSTPSQDLATLDRFSASVKSAVANLNQIEPPKAVTALHRRLIATVRSYQPIISTAKVGFVEHDARKVIAARTQFASSLTRVSSQITQNIDAINQKLRS